MAGYIHSKAAGKPGGHGDEPVWVRWILITLAAGFVSLFLVLPLASVFAGAFARGPAAYFAALRDPSTLGAVKLTLGIAVVVVPLNCIFGIAAAWAVTMFHFRGKPLLLTLIDLPFAISPVVVGVMLIVLFGAQGYFGPWLRDHDIRVLFALPGMVLATLFVTFPFVARELIPIMQQRGSDEEQAALTLGSGGWRIFWTITLPAVKWGVVYGVILANARAMGEFGAVYVVSRPVPGEIPLPLWVDVLNLQYKGTEAFAVASILTFLALGSLGLKMWLEIRQARLESEGQSAANPTLPNP